MEQEKETSTLHTTKAVGFLLPAWDRESREEGMSSDTQHQL